MRKCKGYKCRVKNICERFTESPSDSDMRSCIDSKKFIRKDGTA